MKTEIVFQGQVKSKEWDCYQWLVRINGVEFSYRTGLGHATPAYNKYGDKRNQKPENSLMLQGSNAFKGGIWVHIPKIDDVLNCLFSDASAGNESFDEFCDNMGASNDSLSALDTYRACMEGAKKLRQALSSEYESERKRIEALEL